MPHPVDFQEIENKLFLLGQLCYSSRSYARASGLSKGDDPDFIEPDWIQYAGNLASIVGDYTVECAAKTRVAQDFIRRHDASADIEMISDNALEFCDIGRYDSGKNVSSIRESCNKLIHATEAQLQWEKDQNSGEDYEYWNGIYSLNGEYHGSSWSINFDINKWTDAMTFYHRRLKNKVDWFNIWKHVFK